MKRLFFAALLMLSPELTGLALAESANVWGRRALNIQAHIDDHAPFSQTTWIGTHNSYNAKNWGYDKDPHQKLSLREQLDAGVREIVFDLAWQTAEGGAESFHFLCHGEACKTAVGGAKTFSEGLEVIQTWLTDGHDDQVLMLKLDIAGGHYDAVRRMLQSKVGAFLYTPTINEAPVTDASQGNCKALRPNHISKRNILDAGKNIVVITTQPEADACNFDDAGFKDMVFIGVTDVEADEQGQAKEVFRRQFDAVKTVSDCQHYPHKPERMTRAVDTGAWSGGEFPLSGGADAVERLQAFFDCGLNIFEMFNFDAKRDKGDTEHSNLFAKDMVWSWDQGQPNNGQNNQDCAAVRSAANDKFDDVDCEESMRFACWSDGVWSIPDASRPWSSGFEICRWDGDKAFAAPRNKMELNALNQVKAQAGVAEVWINYSDQAIEGEWLANRNVYADIVSRRFLQGGAIGGNGGSEFDDIDQLKLDLYRDQRRVTQVKMSAADRVDKVGFVYSDDRSVSHGGSGFDRELILASDEYIYKAEVCIDKHKGSTLVSYLQFTTNKNRTLAGGKKTNNCRTTSGSSNREIFAMFGRAGGELDQVGFYLRQHVVDLSASH